MKLDLRKLKLRKVNETLQSIDPKKIIKFIQF